jgi:hypothetical protein
MIKNITRKIQNTYKRVNYVDNTIVKNSYEEDYRLVEPTDH